MVYLAGPDCIEFGWMLMRWQAKLRWLAHHDNEIIVACEKYNNYFYADFAKEIIEVTKDGNDRDRWLYKGKEPKIKKQIRDVTSYGKYIHPCRGICDFNHSQEFIKFGKPEPEFDILIHARSLNRHNSDVRNWPELNYIRLAKMFPKHRIASIGRKRYAIHIRDTVDMREVQMEKLCNLMAGAKVCVGTSSGPLHLASLCGCPHVVFTSARYQPSILGTNKDRYEKIWNPLKTRCTVLDAWDWHPPILAVEKAVRTYL